MIKVVMFCVSLSIFLLWNAALAEQAGKSGGIAEDTQRVQGEPREHVKQPREHVKQPREHVKQPREHVKGESRQGETTPRVGSGNKSTRDQPTRSDSRIHSGGRSDRAGGRSDRGAGR